MEKGLEPETPAGVGKGWTFDEDISWGYGATHETAAAVASMGGAMPQPEQSTDRGVASLRPPPRGAPAPARTARPDPVRAEPAPGAATPYAPPSPAPQATPPAAAQHRPPSSAPATVPGRPAATPGTGALQVVGSQTHPARMVLGMATLAAERLRGGTPSGEAFVTGVGLVQQTATGARNLAKRMLGPASRAALDTMDIAAKLPVAGAPLRSLARSRDRVARALADARTRGQATVAAGRADAEAFVRSNVAETISWAQAQAVPQIVDGLVPHLVDEVVPRILEGTMPEIRATVLPAVIDDLTNSPQLRDLVLEQGRGVVGDATEHLRNTTAAADDRVESAFRRLVRAPAPGPTDQSANGG